MTPDEFLALADNPNFIEGIYNYCDRWCEKCTMTTKCLLFASTPVEENEDADQNDPQAMFRQVESSLQLAVDLLNKIAEEQNLNLDEIREDQSFAEIRLLVKEELHKSPLIRLSKEYLDATHHWIHHFDPVAKDKELHQAYSLQLPNREPEQEAQEIKDALDVINWYYLQIHVKLVRASKQPHSEDEDEIEFSENDSSGSAKVALIGMDHSKDAWLILLNHFPEEEPAILHHLSILTQLIQLTESRFPNARLFIRIGFDDLHTRCIA